MSRLERMVLRSALATLLAFAGCGAMAAPDAPHQDGAPTQDDGTVDTGDVTGAPRNRFGQSDLQPRPAGTIRVATYNLLNLFDDADDPALSGRYEDMEMRTSDARCRSLAVVIRGVDADVLAVQEIESEDALRWFRDRYLPDAGYQWIAAYDVGNVRGIECGVLSRFPIENARVWPREPLDGVVREGQGWAETPPLDEPLVYQRSPLMVEVRVDDDYALTLFVLHHKAGRDFKYRREAEALRTMEKVRAIEWADPRRNIIVLGDFNAAPWDKSLRVYLEGGLIDTLAHRSTDRRSPESRLYRTHESERVLDYVLVNGAAHRELVIGSAHVLGTLYDPEYDWRTDPFPAGYAADHYPVIVDLTPRDTP